MNAGDRGEALEPSVHVQSPAQTHLFSQNTEKTENVSFLSLLKQLIGKALEWL
jgi:hypothetical protein